MDKIQEALIAKFKVVKTESLQETQTRYEYRRIINLIAENDVRFGTLELYIINIEPITVWVTVYIFGREMPKLSKVLDINPMMHSGEINDLIKAAFELSGIELNIEPESWPPLHCL